ncbi:hypothetical protein HBI12_086820 [Parastagonospora nodorum]|nr:hypothetical protein HBI12_086820 [Parastagonospora nodorum]
MPESPNFSPQFSRLAVNLSFPHNTFEVKMIYTSISPVSPEDDTHHNRNDDDAVSILSNAAPPSGYQAYRPPPTQEYTHSPMRSQQQATSYSSPSVTYTPAPASSTPSPPAQNPLSRPGRFPSRTPSPPKTPISTLGFRSQLLTNRDRGQTYTEVLPWTESTHLHSAPAAHDSRPGVGVSAGTRQEAKQYHRSPRHLKRTWRAGCMRRFPWKGAMAMGMLCMLTGSCTALLYASDKSTPESWPAGIQPPTYLSIMEILICLMTLGALGEGVAISFWTGLLRGTTIGKINDVYCLRTLWSASRALARLQLKKLGFATLVSAISLSRGPLFQRALVLREGKYELHVVYVALGMVVSYTSILSTMPLYHGYWHLGRSVSLNPLEIARAFGAPMFDGLDGNVTAGDIEVEMGVLAVRLGAVERNGKEKALRVECTEKINVRKPIEGEIFG